MRVDEGDFVPQFVDGTRQHEHGNFVNARHGLKSGLSKIASRHRKMTAFKMRLGERRIVIAPECQIAEGAALTQKVNHVRIDCIILVAPSHPVRKRFLRNQPLQERILFAFAPCKPFNFPLVAQNCIAENIRTVTAIVFRLLMPGGFSRARCTHDGAEHIERHFRKGTLQGIKPRSACKHLLFGKRMLA